MKCPYCLSLVEDEAVVCKVCTRDLYLFKPMMEKVRALEEKIQTQQSVDELQLRIAELEDALLQAHEAAHAKAEGFWRHLFNLAQFFLIPLALLLLGHALVTVVYDLPLLYLRVISVVLPMPFGYWLFRSRKRILLPWFIAAAGLASASVVGMSAITGWVDHTPVMPQNLVEWKEFIEYAASISFSFLTGMWLGGMAYHRTHRRASSGPHRLLKAVVGHLSEGKLSGESVQQLVSKLESLGGTAVAIGTTAMSVYTGLKSIL
jgi:hypothetical protein